MNLRYTKSLKILFKRFTVLGSETDAYTYIVKSCG